LKYAGRAAVTVAALLLVILGTSLGQFAGEMVAQSARNSGIDFAPPWRSWFPDSSFSLFV
jgi:hypothetical protein